MAEANRFRFQQTAPDGGCILRGERVIAEIRNLELFQFHPVREEQRLIGNQVGIPLFWRQYHRHQEPERSVNCHRRLKTLQINADSLRLEAQASTQSGAVESRFEISFTVDLQERVSLQVAAQMRVVGEPGWLVTPHDDHGEATFLTLWPESVFPTNPTTRKRYHTCLVEEEGAVTYRIRHHHLVSPDKRHITLGPGSRFAWALEEWNPVVTIGRDTDAEAGLCAYMWDAHFGLKLCTEGQEVRLDPGICLTAAYTLSAESRQSLVERWAAAPFKSAGTTLKTPVWTGGFHNFVETFQDETVDHTLSWPWETSVLHGSPRTVKFHRDTETGFHDQCSLRITASEPARACWLATTIGPAYGEAPFARNTHFKVSAMVRSEELNGTVQLGLRIHREDCGSVYQLDDYHFFQSPSVSEKNRDWQRLELTTPLLDPAPDRVHILLLLDGSGSVWFDEVDFERLS